MVYSGFFDGDALYGQEEFNRYFAYLYESGVSMNDAGEMMLKVSSVGSGKIVVDPGFAILKGFYLYNDAALELTVDPDPVYPRLDRVVCRVKMAERTAEIALVKGTASSKPTVPVLSRGDTVYELSLAQLQVAADGTVSVKDERSDVTVCGAIRPKNLFEYNTMIISFQQQWKDWFADQQGNGWRNVYIQEEEPGEAVAGSIWIRTEA